MNSHKRSKQDMNSKINHIRNSEREEILRELQLEEGDEYRAIIDYNAEEKGTQTEGNVSCMTISVQFNKPKQKRYHKAVQVAAPRKMDRITQTTNPEPTARNVPSFTNFNEMEKSFLNSHDPIRSRKGSVNLDAFGSNRHRMKPEENEVIEIIDDEDEDEIGDMLENIDEDQLDQSPLTDTIGSNKMIASPTPSGPNRKNPLLNVPKSTTNIGSSPKNLLVRQPSMVSNNSGHKDYGKILRLPSGVFDDRPNLTGRKSVSLRGLKEIAAYFDEAIVTKSAEDLTKEKENLKMVIKKLDEFIEFNKKNISKLDKEALDSKKRILEQVEARMIEFSDIQTRYYQAIFDKESASGKRSEYADSVPNEMVIHHHPSDPAIHRPSIKVEVIKKMKSKNNQMISEANNILKKILIRNTKKEIRKENTVSRRGANLIPFINKIYNEYMTLAIKAKKEAKGFPSVPLSVFAYKLMSFNFSTNELVQKKYEAVLACIISNSDSSSINLFGRFLGITGNFDHRCFEIFIDMLQQFKKIT